MKFTKDFISYQFFQFLWGVCSRQSWKACSYIAPWTERLWNRPIHFKDLFPVSSAASGCASERTNDRHGARERSEQCGASTWVSGVSEQASVWANKRVAQHSTRWFHSHCTHCALFQYCCSDIVSLIANMTGKISMQLTSDNKGGIRVTWTRPYVRYLRFHVGKSTLIMPTAAVDHNLSRTRIAWMNSGFLL